MGAAPGSCRELCYVLLWEMPASSGLKLSFMVSRGFYDNTPRVLVELSQYWDTQLFIIWSPPSLGPLGDPEIPEGSDG